jgi:hypothetical protein
MARARAPAADQDEGLRLALGLKLKEMRFCMHDGTVMTSLENNECGRQRRKD